MSVRISPRWLPLLQDEFAKEYFRTLAAKVREEYLRHQVFPAPRNVFRAFDLCAPQGIKVVILGQDPYHTPGVADGLAFSSLPGNPIPPSLQNIYKEIEAELGITCERSPDLTRWAKQGVLLLNASLTVRSGLANSHSRIGWHQFTDAVIRTISKQCEHVVFLLWGSFARSKAPLIDFTRHLVLESAHPSPLSAHQGFFGNGHFRDANEYLKSKGKGTINWQ
jgi:uracil-DNA glycosylase